MLINKFNKNSYALIKKSLNCYHCFDDNRILDGISFRIKNRIYLDFGNKYLLEIVDSFILNNFFFKVNHSQNISNILIVNRMVLKKTFSDLYVWILIKKAYYKRYFLKGRFLNNLKSGFAIGICGFVGFLPKTLSLSNNSNCSIYFIQKLDIDKKIFILSQKSLKKLASKILFKLRFYLKSNVDNN